MHPEVYEYNLSVTLRDARRDPRWLVILPLVLPPPEEQRMDALDLIASVGTFVAMYPEHQQDCKRGPSSLLIEDCFADSLFVLAVLHVLSSNPGIAPFLPLLISRFPGVTTTPDPETRSQSSSLSGNMWDDVSICSAALVNCSLTVGLSHRMRTRDITQITLINVYLSCLKRFVL